RRAARRCVDRILRLTLEARRAARVRGALLPRAAQPCRHRRACGLRRRCRAVRRRLVVEGGRSAHRSLPLLTQAEPAAAGRPRAALRRAGGARRHSRPLSAARRSAGTLLTASTTIARLIFEVPSVRSTNVIGTSSTRKPLRIVRYVPSIWN